MGLSVDLFTGMGAAVNALPGGEIVPAMDSGLLDAAEFNNASSDRLSASPMCPRCACCKATTSRASSSKFCSTRTKYDSLPAELKAHARTTRSKPRLRDMSWKATNRYSQDYIDLQTKNNVKFYKTPDAMLQRQLNGVGWDRRQEVGRKSAVQARL